MPDETQQNTDGSDADESDESSLKMGALMALALVPLIAMGGLMAYLLQGGGGISSMRENRPPVQKLHIDRIVLPSQNQIKVHVTNEGPEPVKIAQVLVDDAYWRFDTTKDGPLEPLSSTVVEIPYMWTRGAKHDVTLITDTGATFGEEIPVALETPKRDAGTLGMFALVGLYVGILPVFLGMLWYPLITRVPAGVYHFVLALTLGLLAYLAVGTWLEAIEFSGELAAFWQGVPLVVLISAFVFLGLTFLGTGSSGESSPLRISYLIALGIGLHNFGEGLAIGVAYAGGEVALSTFLIVGFALHNLTEGVGIVAPIARDRPALHHFLWLVLVGGAPAIIGTWIGGYAFSPLLGVVFLSIGIGAILQVIWEVGRLLMNEMDTGKRMAMSYSVYAGLLAGAMIMYFTGWFT